MSLVSPTKAPDAVRMPGPLAGGSGKRCRISTRSIISSMVVTTMAPASSTCVCIVA